MVAQRAKSEPVPVQIIELEGRFYGSSEANGWYDLGAIDESGKRVCECKGCEYRGICKHLRALTAHLSCPRCLGSCQIDWVTINIILNRTRTERVTCPGCLGEGTRSAFEELEAMQQSAKPPADPLAEWRAMDEEARKQVFA